MISNLNLHSTSSNNLNGLNVGSGLLNSNGIQIPNKSGSGGFNTSMRSVGVTKLSPIASELKSSIVVITAVLRVNNFATFKSSCALVENYGKWLCEALHYCAVDLRDLLIVCSACNRSLIRVIFVIIITIITIIIYKFNCFKDNILSNNKFKERDKQCITRAVCCELVHAIKFKCELVEKNYMTIVELILQDFGEEINTTNMSHSNALDTEKSDDCNVNDNSVDDISLYNTSASEAIRPFMSEILEFIADLHVLSKIKVG